MPNNDKGGSVIVALIKEAFRLEMGTNAGRYNLFFSSLLLVLVFILSASDVIMTGIFAWAFKERYPALSFGEALTPFLVCGGLCFLYMVFIADNRKKFTRKSDAKKKEKPFQNTLNK